MAEDAGGEWVTVAERSSLGEGQMVGATVGDRQILAYNVGGEIYATDAICTHAFAQLTDGILDGDVIECPLHGACFSVKTGKVLGPPASQDLQTFPTRIVGDDVQVRIDVD